MKCEKKGFPQQKRCGILAHECGVSYLCIRFRRKSELEAGRGSLRDFHDREAVRERRGRGLMASASGRVKGTREISQSLQCRV